MTENSKELTGALAEGHRYVHEQAKPWQTAGIANASDDPYVLELYGTLYADLQASLALADVAGDEIEAAIQRGAALSPAQRTKAAGIVYTAKVHAHPGGARCHRAHLRPVGRSRHRCPLRLRPILAQHPDPFFA